MSWKAAHLADWDFLLCSFQRRSLAFGLILASSAMVVASFYQPTAAAELKVNMNTRQKKSVTADGLISEADKLRTDWQEASLRQAIKKYEQARLYYRTAHKSQEEARALSSIGDVCLVLGEYQESLGYHAQALELSRSIGDHAAEIESLNRLSYLYVDLGQAQKALDYSKQAQELSLQIGDHRGEARAIDNAGLAHYVTGDMPQALSLFSKALALWRDIGDHHGEAHVLLNMGHTYSNLGEIQKALACLEEALKFSQAVNDRREEALALTALGGVYSWLGEKQRALNSHTQAMQLLKTIGDRNGQAAAANGIAYVYDDLGDKRKALKYYGRALDLYRLVGNRNYTALTLGYVGRMHYALGDNITALENLNQKLLLSRELGDRRMGAYTVSDIGAVYESLRETDKALGFYIQANAMSEEMKDPRAQAYTLNRIGNIYRSLGDSKKALEYYNRALPLIRGVEDKRGETLTLYYMACVDRDLGRPEEARLKIEEVIRTVEALRTKVASHEMRASYFASFHEYYEFYIDLLIQLHRQRPKDGLDALAFTMSERRRARSLLDALTEASANIREGVDGELLMRERELQYLLNTKAEQRVRLLSGKHTPEQAALARKELEDLLIQYQEVQGQVRDKSPRYAALTQPELLTVGEIQHQVLDSSTMLLEYSLGSERSYLWALTQTSVATYELPGRVEIENLTRRLYDLLTARNRIIEGETPRQREKRLEDADSQYAAASAKLSKILLEPVAPLLRTNRLVIVADGALQYVPFVALPDPGQEGTYQPLGVNHEIVSLPSASTLAVFRKENGGRASALKTLAVLADPVFEKDDARVAAFAGGTKSARRPREKDSTRAISMASDTPIDGLEAGEQAMQLQRLPFASQEAATITSLVAAGESMQALGFDASRVTAMSSDLAQYRIIHFATHALVDSQSPDLSSIVLSLVDRSGRRQNGFLTLNEIYNLKLPAELVVLSACRTALGKQIRGEGLIGLTRGFMYAGAARVVASLWSVDDRSAAELMKLFYQGMLEQRLRPAAALRAAQVTMWKQKRWHFPYYWAAFVLQGELN